MIVSRGGKGGSAYPELLGPKEVDCAPERVLVWTGVDEGGFAGEDAVSAAEDVRGAVCEGVTVRVTVYAGGQGGKVSDHHGGTTDDDADGTVER